MRRRRTRAARWAAGAVVVAGAAAAGLVVSHHGSSPSGCTAVVDAVPYRLDLEQAANATTIAAVGKRLGLGDHAVTVALAAALQESGLHNLRHGDRDSLGLFQQRPSQGWGTPAQILTPRLAAAAFYQRLARVEGWASLPVTQAAQQVQHSADAGAYAQWEPRARALARVLTGEIAAGLTCRFGGATGGAAPTALAAAVAAELGEPSLGTPLSPARGWTVAGWLVGHADRFDVRSVSFAGVRWTPGSGSWVPTSGPAGTVEVRTGPGGAAFDPSPSP